MQIIDGNNALVVTKNGIAVINVENLNFNNFNFIIYNNTFRTKWAATKHAIKYIWRGKI